MRLSPSWSAPPPSLTLGSGHVHVWLADLDTQTRHNQRYDAFLHEAERVRAERFVREHDRNHFVAARGVLRMVLGGYLGVEPAKITFVLGPYGKPALDPHAHPEPLQFNISHSAGLALFAFSFGRQVGVDIECERQIGDMDMIAEQFFSSRETADLRSVPDLLRQSAFFNCWSRKEAYIKGTGRGLSQSLADFDVSLKPGEPAAILAVRDDPDAAGHWSLQELITVPGYAAALAVEGHDWTLSYWYLSE